MNKYRSIQIWYVGSTKLRILNTEDRFVLAVLIQRLKNKKLRSATDLEISDRLGFRINVVKKSLDKLTWFDLISSDNGDYQCLNPFEHGNESFYVPCRNPNPHQPWWYQVRWLIVKPIESVEFKTSMIYWFLHKSFAIANYTMNRCFLSPKGIAKLLNMKMSRVNTSITTLLELNLIEVDSESHELIVNEVNEINEVRYFK